MVDSWSDGPVTVLVGDVVERLRELEPESVHCVVTSPPYWGLRDYGAHGQIGLEATPQEYVERLVQVFAEVRRVLRRDGTVWLNLGDSYAAQGGGKAPGVYSDKRAAEATWEAPRRPPGGLKAKDLVGLPWRVALALQADGWWLRSDIIWAKPNPMPESVRDRPTNAHEHVFLLAKTARYFYDHAAVREPHTDTKSMVRFTPGGRGKTAYATASAGPVGQPQRDSHGGLGFHPSGRNLRNVWTIATQPYPDAHFATFPEELARRCIAAGTSERGCCRVCGAPWRRVVERSLRPRDMGRPQAQRAVALASAAGLTDRHILALQAAGVSDSGKARVTQDGFGKNTAEVIALAQEAKDALGGYHREFLLTAPATIGLEPACRCEAPEPVPCTVLDPFAGSGTTLAVARRTGRRAVGIELQQEYLPLIQRRVSGAALPLLEAIGG